MMISRKYLMTLQAIMGVLVLTFGLLLVQSCSEAEHADDDHADNGDVSHDDDADQDDAGDAHDDDANHDDDDDDDDANGDAHDDDDDAHHDDDDDDDDAHHDDDDDDGDAHHDDDDGDDDAHHDDDDDHAEGGHGEPVEFTTPQTYAQAIEAIYAQLEKIERLIAIGGLNFVHAEAAVIRDIANGIGRLALKEGSGVPRDAVREINLTAKDLAAKFGPIDEAGDSGDSAGTQKVYDEMVALFETLEKYVPDHDDDEHDDH